MLSDQGKSKLQMITGLVNKSWNSNVQILNVEIIDAPFDMFNIRMVLYKRFEVLLTYDRSIVGLNVKRGDEFINIRKLTTEETVKGFKSSERESVMQNLKVLDKVIRAM